MVTERAVHPARSSDRARTRSIRSNQNHVCHGRGHIGGTFGLGLTLLLGYREVAEPATDHVEPAKRGKAPLDLSIPFAFTTRWAQLLRRIDWVDVLACPCGGRQAIVADVSNSEVVVAILAHLGLPTEAPAIARARSPAFDLA